MMKAFKIGILLLTSILISCKKENIRNHCHEISKVSYYSYLTADGFDTIPKEGSFLLKNGDTLCLFMNELNNLGSIINDKANKGTIEFRFFNEKNRNIGLISMTYRTNSYGYFINLGGYNNYGHRYLPVFLLNKVRENARINNLKR